MISQQVLTLFWRSLRHISRSLTTDFISFSRPRHSTNKLRKCFLSEQSRVNSDSRNSCCEWHKQAHYLKCITLQYTSHSCVHNTSQYITIPHNTSQYIIIPHNTSQYITIHHMQSPYDHDRGNCNSASSVSNKPITSTLNCGDFNSNF